MCVGEPTADGYRVLWMEYVRGRGVIYNYCLPKVTADLGKILYKLLAGMFYTNLARGTNLDIISLVVVTTVSE